MIAASIVLLGLAAGQAAPTEPKASAPAALFIEASLSTAGPYGELWVLRLTPNGEVLLRAYYSLRPSGSLMAEFDLDHEDIDAIRQALVVHQFFDLPTEISAKQVPLHQPDFHLEVILGSRRHKVQLYDPASLAGNEHVTRFLAVWKRLFEGLPLKPSW